MKQEIVLIEYAYLFNHCMSGIFSRHNANFTKNKRRMYYYLPDEQHTFKGDMKKWIYNEWDSYLLKGKMKYNGTFVNCIIENPESKFVLTENDIKFDVDYCNNLLHRYLNKFQKEKSNFTHIISQSKFKPIEIINAIDINWRNNQQIDKFQEDNSISVVYIDELKQDMPIVKEIYSDDTLREKTDDEFQYMTNSVIRKLKSFSNNKLQD